MHKMIFPSESCNSVSKGTSVGFPLSRKIIGPLHLCSSFSIFPVHSLFTVFIHSHSCLLFFPFFFHLFTSFLSSTFLNFWLSCRLLRTGTHIQRLIQNSKWRELIHADTFYRQTPGESRLGIYTTHISQT